MAHGNGQGEPKDKEPVDWVMDLFVHTPIGLAVMAWKRMPELVSAVPDLVGQAVSKGCAQLAGAEERLSEEVRKARMIGQVAVTFGGRQLRREVDARLRDAKQAAGGLTGFLPNMTADVSNGAGADTRAPVTASDTPTAPASPTTAAKAGAAKAGAAKAGAKPAAARKPATKAAGARKATKTSGTKASGATKRARSAATATSADDLPIPEYDGLSASQVVSRLSGLTPEELQAIRSYEEASRGRRTVLVAIERLLS